MEQLFSQFNRMLEERGIITHKDTIVDARWTKKRHETHYGYKDHVKMDADSKLILDYVATPF